MECKSVFLLCIYGVPSFNCYACRWPSKSPDLSQIHSFTNNKCQGQFLDFFFSYVLYVFRQIRHWISGCFDDQLGDKTMQSVRQRQWFVISTKTRQGVEPSLAMNTTRSPPGSLTISTHNFTDLKTIRTAHMDPGGERPTAAVRAKAKQGPNGIPR